MTVASTLVAAGIGLLLGWGMRTGEYERRSLVVALSVGVAAGAVVLALSLGSDPALAGGSLVVGCLSALAVLMVRQPR